MHNRKRNVTESLLCVLSAIFVLPIPLALLALNGTYGLQNWRNFHLLLLVAFITLRVTGKYKLRDLLTADIAIRYQNLFWIASFIGIHAATLLHLFGFATPGEDFSFFDHMLYQTNHGRFMFAPLCNCNHFGTHPSYILLPFVAVHRLFSSPIILQLVHAFCIWFAGLLLFRLSRHYFSSPLLAFLLAVCFYSNAWIGAILNGSFHIEVFYVPASLLLALGITRNLNRSFWLGALLALSVKEDAAVWLSSLGVGLILKDLFSKRSLHRNGFILIALCIAVFSLNHFIVQPHFLKMDQIHQPHYLRFWGHFGPNIPAIVMHILTHPFSVALYFLSSSWYKFFGYLWFLPLFSWYAFWAMLPTVFLLGVAAPGEHNLRNFSMYYTAPILGFAFWGILEGVKFLASYFPKVRMHQQTLLVLVFLTAGLFDSHYIRFPSVNWPLLAEIQYLKKNFQPNAKKLCAQDNLIPHLPYEWETVNLNETCLADAVVIYADSLDFTGLEKRFLEKFSNHKNKMIVKEGTLMKTFQTFP